MCVGFASDLIDGRNQRRGVTFAKGVHYNPSKVAWWMTPDDLKEGQRLIERLTRSEIDQVWAAEWFCMLTNDQLDALHWRERQLRLR